MSSAGLPVVGIGASAGGLEAFEDLLGHLPADTGFAFVLIPHLDPTHASMLASLLSRFSLMPVHEARDGVKLGANCVYVIPPNTYLAIEDGSLRLTPRPERRGAPMPIDHFLSSLATHLGGMAIGVILSGTGSDGATGLGEIKARGGLTFAQDEQTATYSGMPRAAVQTGAVDFVLSPADIAREIGRIARSPGALWGRVPQESSGLVDGSADLRRVLALMKQATGADLSYYKPPTLIRRLARRMLLRNLSNLAEYIRFLEEHPAELQQLHNDILISVTSFFRDEEMLEGLSRHVFPSLVKNRRADDAIRIWAPGCSTGEEAYSIAIALLEFLTHEKVHYPIQIFATDLSELSVARCRQGLYGDDVALSAERLKRFFVKTEHGYQVSKSIRDLVIFAKHNLLSDPPFSQLDLISCRNLLIYLRPEYQRRAFDIFHYALKPTGLLMLGRSETAGAATELFAPVDKPTRVYAKNPAARRTIHFAPRLEVSKGAVPAMPAADPAAGVRDIVRRADVTLSRHRPPAVVIDDEGEIVHFQGNTRPYLAAPPGPPTANLFKMARQPLQLELRAAVEGAREESGTVRRPLVFPEDGIVRRATVEVTPLMSRDGGGRHFVILFDEEGRDGAEPPEDLARATEPSAGEDEVAQLRRELRQTRLQLEGTIHELETLNEEYRSAHEEALSANEELQSSNEELETAKEELQSGNEELTTVNEELQGRSAELGQTNNDLTNVLSSVQTPIILVGPDLRLRRFTPLATKVLNVIATDIGRPISDITLNVSVPDLTDLVVETMETMRSHERDVQDRQGRWYSMRIRPYRTHDSKIEGVVILLVDVDDLRRALSDASEARLYAESIVATVREPLVVLDERLRVLTANSSFYDTFRVAREQTEGRALFELGNRQWDIPQLRELLEHVIPERASFDNFEARHDFPEIGPRTMLLNARRMDGAVTHPNRILLAIEDVTERRQAEIEREDLLSIAERARVDAERASRAKDETLARFRSLVDVSAQLVWITDSRGEIVEDSPSWRAFTGQTYDEWRGTGWQDALHPDDREHVVALWDRSVAEKTSFEVEYRLRRADGAYCWSLARATPLLAENGSVREWIGMNSDIDARKRGDVELETLLARTEQARIDAEAASHAKDEFLALLSHELRNPLSAVRTAIITAQLDETRRERALDIAGRQSERLTHLVEDLLDVARITQGKIRLRLDRVPLGGIVDRAVESVASFIEERGQTLSVSRSGDYFVDVDPARLEQVVGNLLANAAKYTEPGGRIEVEIDREDADVVLRVRDNGMGIPPELLPRIFELFAQGETKFDRAQGGLGIGLTVVRRLVELHGGRIEARSEGQSRGAEFTVRLPSVPGSGDADDVTPRAPDLARSVRVLVVEDNPDAAEGLQLFLEMLGHRVRVAHDGPAALDAVSAEVPDLALIDIGLPGMDGYELVSLLRKHPGMEHVTLAALSGYGRDADKERAVGAGFHLHLTKPVSMDRLKALLANLDSLQDDGL